MKWMKSKKLLLLVVVLGSVFGVTVAAAAVGPGLPIKGTASACLTRVAESALAAAGVKLEVTGEATLDGSCVTKPGTGTISMDLLFGEIPVRGGKLFSNGKHTLEVTNERIHIGSTTTTADVSVDGGPVTSIDLYHYAIDLSKISLTLTSAEARDLPIYLTEEAAAIFAAAFGAESVSTSEAMHSWTAKGEITNPLGPSNSCGLLGLILHLLLGGHC